MSVPYRRPRALAWLWLAVACAPVPDATVAPEALTAGPPSASAPQNGFPRTIDLPDGSRLSLAAAPRRVVPASSGLCELVCALLPPEAIAGLPAQADAYCDLSALDPAYAARPRFETYAAEPLLLLSPDLVLADSWGSAETSARLRQAGVPVLAIGALERLDDVLDAVAVLGRIVGREEQAAALGATLRARAAALEARSRGHTRPRALVYSNGGSGGWVAGADTAADAWLALAGFANAASEHPGHRRCNFEELLLLDPDLLVLSGPGGSEPSGVTARLLLDEPTLAGLRAVAQRRMVELPPRLHDGVGLGIVTAAERLAQLAAQVLPPS